jgi:hypothetical protein
MSVRDLPFFPTVNTSGGTQNDGISPTITVSEITGGYRLTIVDAAGTKSIDIMNGSAVQADLAQNDSTQPDYVKNRLAYRCRKFEDMEATEYPEPVLGVIRFEEDGEIYEEPVLLKFSDLPENVTPYEIIEELIGIGFMGEEMRFDDPEAILNSVKNAQKQWNVLKNNNM